MNDDELRLWSSYVYELCGIHLNQTKAYLIESRLAELQKENHCGSLGELYLRSKSDSTGRIAESVIDAITTGETSFFRDSTPFDLLKAHILPDLIMTREEQWRAMGRIPIRVWSAASSSGQEAYSMAILFHQLVGDDPRYEVSIQGTDISKEAVARAQAGEYSTIEMDRGMSTETLAAYFDRDGASWKAKDHIRKMVSFRKFNLHQPFNFVVKYDLVLCRNVAIYFTDDDKRSLFERMADTLEKDGILMIGSTESLSGITDKLEAHSKGGAVYYQRTGVSRNASSSEHSSMGA